jgi:hypothetical protein
MKLVFDSRRAAIRLAKRLRYEKPHLSFQQIADVLNARGHRNSIGTPFDADSVARLLGKGVKKGRTLTPVEMKEIYVSVGLGASQASLAAAYGVSRSTVSKAVRRVADLRAQISRGASAPGALTEVGGFERGKACKYFFGLGKPFKCPAFLTRLSRFTQQRQWLTRENPCENVAHRTG